MNIRTICISISIFWLIFYSTFRCEFSAAVGKCLQEELLKKQNDDSHKLTAEATQLANNVTQLALVAGKLTKAALKVALRLSNELTKASEMESVQIKEEYLNARNASKLAEAAQDKANEAVKLVEVNGTVENAVNLAIDAVKLIKNAVSLTKKAADTAGIAAERDGQAAINAKNDADKLAADDKTKPQQEAAAKELTNDATEFANEVESAKNAAKLSESAADLTKTAADLNKKASTPK